MRQRAIVLSVLAGFAILTSVQQAIAWDLSTPVWSQTRTLLCRSTDYHVCALYGACQRRQPTAVWLFDFERNLVTYQGVNFQEQIVARDLRSVSGSGLRMTLLLSSGRLMELRYSNFGNLTGWSVGIPEPAVSGSGHEGSPWALQSGCGVGTPRPVIPSRPSPAGLSALRQAATTKGDVGEGQIRFAATGMRSSSRFNFLLATTSRMPSGS
jgi:hypothetical protein